MRVTFHNADAPIKLLPQLKCSEFYISYSKLYGSIKFVFVNRHNKMSYLLWYRVRYKRWFYLKVANMTDQEIADSWNISLEEYYKSSVLVITPDDLKLCKKPFLKLITGGKV